MVALRARLLTALLALAASLVFGTAGFEIVSRRIGLPLPTLDDPAERGKLFAYDATKGWFHTPGVRTARYIRGPDEGRITINSLGLRGPEIGFTPERGVTRILVLGDSFAFGAGVNDEHTFPARLGDDLGPGFEVVNLGVTGYSTDQELILYEELGAKLHAALVLLLMCDNDFEANTQDFVFYVNYKPWFELSKAGELIRHNEPVPRLSRAEQARAWLARHANTYKLLKAIAIGRRGKHLEPVHPWLYDRLAVAVSRPSFPDVKLTAHLVDALREKASSTGAGFVVLNTGHRHEVTGLYRPLRKHFDRVGIEYLPLETILEEARTKRRRGLWDFRGDTHWNVGATALVADTVAALVRRRGTGRAPLGAGS
jgi:hypothetical protein